MADTKRLYAIAAKMGMVERGGDDPLHQLVYTLTGKEHVSELTDAEGKTVEAELLRLKRSTPSRPKQYESIPGMMTESQKRYAWRLIYRLKELDGKKTPVNKRMAGAVKKILDITANPKEPLRWVNRENGSKLIEALKRYVRSAERKARDG